MKIRLPKLYGKQWDAMYSDARFSVIEASTKAGKTFSAIVWQMHQCMTVKGHHWWVAPVYPQARIAWDRVRQMLPKGVFSANESQLKIVLGNGSTWWFKSGEKPDNLYGEDVESAVVDEASRMREESWTAIVSTLTATSGPARIIGNVKGRGNWFYRLARKAQQGTPDHHYAKLTAYDAVEAGVLDRYVVEQAREMLPEHVFKELYLAEPSEDGSNPFDVRAIEASTGTLSEDAPVCWGWDLAKSMDWTVGIALDAFGRVCRFHRFQRTWEQTTDFIASVTHVPALIDSSGVGDPIVERLQRMGVHAEGFKFTSSSKQRLMEGLAVAIQRGELGFPEGPIVDELLTFEYEHTRTATRYSAPAGLHDDCVCALALAVSMRQRVTSTVVHDFTEDEIPFFVARPARF